MVGLGFELGIGGEYPTHPQIISVMWVEMGMVYFGVVVLMG
jgi:hypothetical protein